MTLLGIQYKFCFLRWLSDENPDRLDGLVGEALERAKDNPIATEYEWTVAPAAPGAINALAGGEHTC